MWSMLMPINEIGFDKIKAIGFLIPVLSSSTWRISYHWRTGLLVPDGMVACSGLGQPAACLSKTRWSGGPKIERESARNLVGRQRHFIIIIIDL